MLKDKVIKSKIKRLIVEVLRLEIEPEEIEDNEMLFGGELGLDSVATIELVIGLESEFEITVPDDDVREELFDSVATLAEYVKVQLKRK